MGQAVKRACFGAYVIFRRHNQGVYGLPSSFTFPLGIYSSFLAPLKSELTILTESSIRTSLSTFKPLENPSKMTLSNIILFNSNIFPSPESRIHILSCPVAAEKIEFFTVKLEHCTPPPISTPILQPSITQSSKSTFSMLKQYPSGEIF